MSSPGSGNLTPGSRNPRSTGAQRTGIFNSVIVSGRFVQGVDGTKIITTKENLYPKFLYY